MEEVNYEEGYSEAESLQLQENLFASLNSNEPNYTEAEYLQLQEDLFASTNLKEFQEEATREQYLNSIEKDITKGIFDKYLEQGSQIDVEREDGIHQISPKDYFEEVKKQYQEAKGIKEDDITKGIDKLVDITEYAEKKQEEKFPQKSQNNELSLSQKPQGKELSQEENQSIADTSKELNEQEKIDYIDLLEKETSADLVINLHEDEDFKKYKEENPKAGIADYLSDLKDKTNNKAQKEGIEDIQKQIKMSFPNAKGNNLFSEAEKQKLDCSLKRTNNSKEYKEYKSEAQKRGEKVNEWSFLKKQLSSPYISNEEAKKIEQTISLIEKYKPEMVNIQQNKEAVNKELSPIRKALLEQFKKEPNITANGEKIAQDILNSLFTPLKVAEKFIKHKQLEKMKQETEGKKFQVYLDQQLYYVQGYSSDFEKINLKNAETGKTLSVDNNTNLQITADRANIKISAAQEALLKQGKTLIIGQDGKQPMICSMKQGELSFKNVDTTTYKKDILKQKQEKSLGQKVKSSLKIKM